MKVIPDEQRWKFSLFVAILLLVAGLLTGKFSSEAIHVPVVLSVVGFECLIGSIILRENGRVKKILNSLPSEDKRKLNFRPNPYTFRDYCLFLISVGLVVLGIGFGSGPPPNLGFMLFFSFWGVFIMIAVVFYSSFMKYQNLYCAFLKMGTNTEPEQE